jgi:hypothetical protein
VGEGPFHSGRRKPPCDNRILQDVRVVVVIYEVMMQRLSEHCPNERDETNANGGERGAARLTWLRHFQCTDNTSADGNVTLSFPTGSDTQEEFHATCSIGIVWGSQVQKY